MSGALLPQSGESHVKIHAALLSFVVTTWTRSPLAGLSAIAIFMAIESHLARVVDAELLLAGVAGIAVGLNLVYFLHRTSRYSLVNMSGILSNPSATGIAAMYNDPSVASNKDRQGAMALSALSWVNWDVLLAHAVFFGSLVGLLGAVLVAEEGSDALGISLLVIGFSMVAAVVGWFILGAFSQYGMWIFPKQTESSMDITGRRGRGAEETSDTGKYPEDMTRDLIVQHKNFLNFVYSFGLVFVSMAPLVFHDLLREDGGLSKWEIISISGALAAVAVILVGLASYFFIDQRYSSYFRGQSYADASDSYGWSTTLNKFGLEGRFNSKYGKLLWFVSFFIVYQVLYWLTFLLVEEASGSKYIYVSFGSVAAVGLAVNVLMEARTATNEATVFGEADRRSRNRARDGRRPAYNKRADTALLM